jgi:molybdate transport system ATP-binding protein
MGGMADEITADFEKVYAEGPAIHAALRLPLGRPHVTVLFGPSGSGKTTVLRCLAGLDPPTRGRISLSGEVWFDAEAGIMAPPQSRAIGYLFQDYALFPHLTVSGNIAYALKGGSRAERGACVRDMLRLLRLEGLENRRPAQLSGGQQQRVALARVLARRPRLLLLDEPLSALDAPTREEVRGELRSLLRSQGTPAICVTHDWVEALALADEVAVIAGGRILQIGSPDEVFSRPANAEVAAIVGVETVVTGRVAERTDDLVALDVGGARLWAVEGSGRGEEFYLSIRAEDVTLEIGASPNSSARNHLVGKVTEVRQAGPVSRVTMDCGFLLTALVTRQAAQDLGLERGVPVTATVKASAIHLIPR